MLDERTLATVARRLARTDPRLATVYRAHGPPPLWDRTPGFETLLRIILEQQVSLASASAVYARVCQQIGALSPTLLIATGEEALRGSGLTRQKAAYWLNVARAVESGDLPLGELSTLDDREAIACLTRVKGVGPWTASVYLLMALLRPDVWPAADLALAVAAQRVLGLDARPDARRMQQLAERWRPWRSVAARMLWQSYLAS